MLDRQLNNYFAGENLYANITNNYAPGFPTGDSDEFTIFFVIN